MEPFPIILASASPRRHELLKSLGVSFSVVPSQAPELHDESLGPLKLCEINSLRKAEEISIQYPNALVIGADTLVSLNGKIFGKPAHLQEAREFLFALSKKKHQVTTGVALLNRSSAKSQLFTETSQVTFKSLPGKIIAEYIARVNVLDKAGAYGIQENGEMLVEHVEGSVSNVIGLPLEKLRSALAEFGIKVGEPDKNGPVKY